MPGLDEFYRYLDKQDKPVSTAEERSADMAVGENGNGHKAGTLTAAGAAAAAVLSADEDAARRPKRLPLTPMPGSAEPGVRYVLRNGVTVAVVADGPAVEEAEVVPVSPRSEQKPPAVATLRKREVEPAAEALEYLPPIIEAHEPTQVADAPVRPRSSSPGRASAAAEEEPLFSDADIVALWQTLPRHIQLLVGMKTEEAEVAQKYYTRNFKESRAQLIERLLDPTLTLEDTARVLGVCPTTVRRYTNRGVLPHHRTVGQQRRFRLSDVLAFLEWQQRARNRRTENTVALLAAHQNGKAAAEAGGAAEAGNKNGKQDS